MSRYNNSDLLIAAIKEGDKSAFEFLFRKYYVALCHYADRYVKDSNVAEDIVAQVFCNLFIKRNELIIQALQPYLFLSVRNGALNHIRGQKSFIDIDEANAERMNHDLANPILHKEAETLLDNAISSLPPHCKEIFLLSRHQRLTYKEIALKLGISVNTVETQMSRAIKKLNKQLGGYIKLLGLLLSFY